MISQGADRTSGQDDGKISCGEAKEKQTARQGFFVGFKYLGGSEFLTYSITATLAYNIGVDITARFLPATGITDDMMLNAIFGGLIAGIGTGMVYQAGGTAGAGGIINRLLYKKSGWPFKLNALLSNRVVFLLAGFVFDLEAVMYSVIAFFLLGTLADFILEGPDIVRQVMIVTDKPEKVLQKITQELERGVTRWQVQGTRADEAHHMLFCTITRPQIRKIKNAVAETDPDAFVFLVHGNEAYGKGFHKLEEHPPVVKDLEQDDRPGNTG